MVYNITSALILVFNNINGYRKLVYNITIALTMSMAT
jgi:hypothetical protein